MRGISTLAARQRPMSHSASRSLVRARVRYAAQFPRADSLGLNSPKARRLQIKPVDERVDEANRIVRSNVVAHRLRKQQKLSTILA